MFTSTYTELLTFFLKLFQAVVSWTWRTQRQVVDFFQMRLVFVHGRQTIAARRTGEKRSLGKCSECVSLNDSRPEIYFLKKLQSESRSLKIVKWIGKKNVIVWIFHNIGDCFKHFYSLIRCNNILFLLQIPAYQGLFTHNVFTPVCYWWLVRVTLVVAFGFFPQNFGR